MKRRAETTTNQKLPCRRRRSPQTGIVIFGTAVGVMWLMAPAFTSFSSSPSSAASQHLFSTSRHLLQTPKYPPWSTSYRQCIRGDEQCSQHSECEKKCDDDEECPGYVIDVVIDPPRGYLCKDIINATAHADDQLFRRPGAPCLYLDNVVVKQKGEEKAGVLNSLEDEDKFLVFLTESREEKSFKSKDVYRRTVDGDLKDCEVESKGNSMYPKEAFSEKQRKNGAIVLYFVGVFYMFFGLAIVCDDYFVPALEVVTVRLDLSDDVSGATFMAAGGSAPELFTSLIGVFIAESEVGFGTIIGSAVFNVLFVIGACAIATRELAAEMGGLPLTWWPLARDSFFYLIALVMLMCFFFDKQIKWYESGLLLVTYCTYVAFMAYNLPVYTWVRHQLDARSGKVVPEAEESSDPLPSALKKGKTGETAPNGENEDARVARKASVGHEEKEGSGSGWVQAKTRARSNSTAQMLTKQKGSKKDLAASGEGRGGHDVEAGQDKEADDANDEKGDDEEDDEPWSPFPPSEGLVKWLLLFPLNFPLWAILPSGQKLGEEKSMFERERKLQILSERLIKHGSLKKKGDGSYVFPSLAWLKEHASDLVDEDEDDLREEDDIRSSSEVLVDLVKSFEGSRSTGHSQAAAFLGWANGGDGSTAAYGVELKEKNGQAFGYLYIGGFFGSIAFIGGFTYLMVWWADIIGQTLGISEVVMGVTLLAAGTSVPDLISSVIVAMDGKGDMAVSSSIGSNIFDVGFGLPMPWFFWSLGHGGEAIDVETNAPGTAVLLLVGMLLSVIGAIAALGWRLNVALGGLSLILYAVFVTLTILMNYDTIPAKF